MTKSFRNLTAIAALFVIVPALMAHPHFGKKTIFSFSQGKDVTLSYTTVPYNEGNPDKLEVGKNWTPFGSKFVSGLALKNGSTMIEAGEYTLQVHKDSANKYSLALGKGSETIPLKSVFKSNLSNADHLDISISAVGEAVHVTLRFGTFMVSAPITAA